MNEFFELSVWLKLPDLDAFNHEQIVGAQRMGQSVSEIIRQLEFLRSTVSRVYQEYMMPDKKTSSRKNCKDQLALTLWVWGALNLREYHCSMLAIRLHRLAWAREQRDWSVENWKRVP
ncbi:hypothetical protein TNCV_753371 [Trichonephila clavipes]|nr:hypothetical protein TNCV_753371 [Trichonephila clavipes]